MLVDDLGERADPHLDGAELVALGAVLVASSGTIVDQPRCSSGPS